jgi:hypothetical protein
VLFERIEAEEVGARAGRNDKVIVGDGGAVEFDEFFREVNLGHLAHLEGEIFLPAENRSHRLGDLRRQQSRNGNLIQQGLEEVVIVFIDECNAHGSVRQSAGGFDARKACADDDDVREMGGVHGDLLVGLYCEIYHHYYNQIGLICKYFHDRRLVLPTYNKNPPALNCGRLG